MVGGVLWRGFFGDMSFIHTPAAEFCKLMGIFSLYFRPWMAHKPTTRSSRRGVGWLVAILIQMFFCQKDRKKEAAVVNLAAWRCSLRWVQIQIF